jgi:hypothetical protein
MQALLACDWILRNDNPSYYHFQSPESLVGGDGSSRAMSCTRLKQLERCNAPFAIPPAGVGVGAYIS